MQQIKIISIAKKFKDECYYQKIEELKKRSSRFADLELIQIYNKDIEKAHKEGSGKAREVYEKYLSKELGKKNIALDVSGKELDSGSFAKLLEDEGSITFFIGGAYGLGESFLDRCQSTLSLSKMTFDHALAAMILSEQIYRGLCILNNHPYADK